MRGKDTGGEMTGKGGDRGGDGRGERGGRVRKEDGKGEGSRGGRISPPPKRWRLWMSSSPV